MRTVSHNAEGGIFAAARPLAVAALLAGLAFGLAGCVGEAPAPQVQAPQVDTGPDVPPGSNEDFIVNVGRRVFFTDGSSALTDTAKTTLDAQAQWLAQYPKVAVKIKGYADDKGTAEFNMTLSKKRAEAAMAYLASKGVAAKRMKAKGYGDTVKTRNCADAGCTAQNRRAITVLDVDSET